MRRSIAIIASTVATAQLAACAPTETGNGQTTEVSFQLGAESSETDAAGAPLVRDASGHPFSFTSVLAHVDRLRLDLPTGVECPDEAADEDCEDSAGWTLEGPWRLDVLAGTFYPPGPQVSLPAGTWDRVRLELRPGPPGVGELQGHALLASGETTLTSGPTPFAIALDEELDVRFDASVGVIVEDGQMPTFHLTWLLDDWLAGVDAARCAEDGDLAITDGVLLLSDGEGECANAADAIADEVEASGRLEDAP